MQLLSQRKLLSDNRYKKRVVESAIIASSLIIALFFLPKQDKQPSNTIQSDTLQSNTLQSNTVQSNTVYVYKEHISEVEYPINQKSVKRAGTLLRSVYENYMQDTDVKTYVAVIPDKNLFMAEKCGKPCMDYTALEQSFLEEMSFAEKIDITEMLSLDDYYMTDSHWRQECITDIAGEILNAMGTNNSAEYERKTIKHPFYGSYSRKTELGTKADEIVYLTNETLDTCRVYDYQNETEIPVYDLEKVDGWNPYEVYLSGPISLITIENDNAKSEKELILFRDSFGSSIAPLLVDGYKSITLVDVRYINTSILGKYIEFKEQDVLFLYSTLVINNMC